MVRCRTSMKMLTAVGQCEELGGKFLSAKQQDYRAAIAAFSSAKRA